MTDGPSKLTWFERTWPWLRWVVFVGTFAIIALISKTIPRVPGIEAVLVPAALLIALDWLEFRQTRASARSLLAKRFRVCDRCCYELESLPDSGTCPECGATYDRGALERTWRARYKKTFEGTTSIAPLEKLDRDETTPPSSKTR